MDKKEIYEHLAKIYLDASLKKDEKKSKDYPGLKNIFFLMIAIIAALYILVLPNLGKNKAKNFEIALILQPDKVKINFNFDPAQKEVYSLNLNRLNLTRYKKLAFAAKKNTYADNIALRVEFSNIFKEKSEVYLKNIPIRWHEYTLDLSSFKGISDWAEMRDISFIVERWNVQKDHGVILIENVRFLK